MNWSVLFFFFLVLNPLVGTPQGVWEMRPLLFPLPPPWGWSTGFMATPLVTGRLPSHLLAPALPNFLFLCWGLDKTPIVAWHAAKTLLCSPLGILTTAYGFSPRSGHENQSNACKSVGCKNKILTETRAVSFTALDSEDISNHKLPRLAICTCLQVDSHLWNNVSAHSAPSVQ